MKHDFTTDRQCRHCGRTIPGRERLYVAGYEMCPYCDTLQITTPETRPHRQRSRGRRGIWR